MTNGWSPPDKFLPQVLPFWPGDRDALCWPRCSPSLTILQKVNGLYSVPIIVIFLMGILTRRANARGAKAAMAVGVLSYAAFTFADVVISDLQWPTWYHWLHGYGISVALAFATVVVFFGQPQVQTEDSHACASPVDMNPWSMAKPIAVMIALAALGLYAGLVLLSSG